MLLYGLSPEPCSCFLTAQPPVRREPPNFQRETIGPLSKIPSAFTNMFGISSLDCKRKILFHASLNFSPDYPYPTAKFALPDPPRRMLVFATA